MCPTRPVPAGRRRESPLCRARRASSCTGCVGNLHFPQSLRSSDHDRGSRSFVDALDRGLVALPERVILVCRRTTRSTCRLPVLTDSDMPSDHRLPGLLTAGAAAPIIRQCSALRLGKNAFGYGRATSSGSDCLCCTRAKILAKKATVGQDYASRSTDSADGDRKIPVPHNSTMVDGSASCGRPAR